MKEFVKNLKLAWKYARNQRLQLVLFIITNIFIISISLIIPIYYSKIVIELTNNMLYQILVIGIIIAGLEILMDITRYFNKFFAQNIYRESFTKIQIDLGNEILKLDSKTLEDNGSGVFIQRLSNDASNMADVFNNILNYMMNLFNYIGRYVGILIVAPIMFLYLFIY